VPLTNIAERSTILEITGQIGLLLLKYRATLLAIQRHLTDFFASSTA